MSSPVSLNKQRLITITRELGSLAEHVTFIGGVAAELLQTSPVLPKVRPTDDVDAVAAFASRSSYDDFSSKLRERGFRNIIVGKTNVYKWKSPSGIAFDAVPTYGFGNKWDEYAIETSLNYELAEGVSIKLVSAPLFLAMKWKAFEERGKADWMLSHDLEDILAVIAGRPTIVEEIKQFSTDVREYITAQCRFLLGQDGADNIIEGALSTASLLEEVTTLTHARIVEVASFQ